MKSLLIGTLSHQMAEATFKPGDEVPIEGVDQRRAQFSFRDHFVRLAAQGDPNSSAPPRLSARRVSASSPGQDDMESRDPDDRLGPIAAQSAHPERWRRAQGVQPPPSGPAVKGSGVAAGGPVVIVVTRPDTAVLAPGTTLPTDDVTGAMGSPDEDGDGDGDGDVDPVPGPEPAGTTRPAGTARGARLSWWRHTRRSGSGEVGQGHRCAPRGGAVSCKGPELAEVSAEMPAPRPNPGGGPPRPDGVDGLAEWTTGVGRPGPPIKPSATSSAAAVPLRAATALRRRCVVDACPAASDFGRHQRDQRSRWCCTATWFLAEFLGQKELFQTDDPVGCLLLGHRPLLPPSRQCMSGMCAPALSLTVRSGPPCGAATARRPGQYESGGQGQQGHGQFEHQRGPGKGQRIAGRVGGRGDGPAWRRWRPRWPDSNCRFRRLRTNSHLTSYRRRVTCRRRVTFLHRVTFRRRAWFRYRWW